MSFKPTIIALVLALLSVAAMLYALRREGPGVASGDIAGNAPALQPLRALPVDDVDRITLRRGDGAPIVFERRNGAWWQVEPFQFPMDLFSIRQFAVLAAQFTRSGAMRPVESDGDTADSALGFEPPRATVTYEWEDGSLTLELGRLVGAGRGYVRLAGGEPVYSVEQALHQRAIQMHPWQWRDRRIFRDVSVEADAVERIVRSDRLVARREQGRWRIIEPVQSRVDGAALQQWMRNLETAQVAEFLVDEPDDLAQFGLDEPEASVSLTTTRQVEVAGEIYPQQTTQQLLIGDVTDASSKDRYAMLEGSPVVFRLSLETQVQILPQTRVVVAQTACGVAPPDIKEIVIRRGSEELRFERDLEKWLAQPDDRPVEPRLVQGLLRQLTDLRPVAIELAPYPMDREVATITLLGFDRRPLTTVRVARDADGERWILENGDNVLRYYPGSLELRLEPVDFALASPVDG